MTSSSRASWIAGALITLLSLGVIDVGAAHAQPRAATAEELERARALYKEGKVLRSRGEWGPAIEKLRAAHALGNTPVASSSRAPISSLASSSRRVKRASP